VRPATLALATLLSVAGCGGSGGHEASVPDARAPETDARTADVVTGQDSGADVGVRHDVDSGISPAVDAGVDAGPWKFAPTIAAAALDQNNTSACGDSTAPCSEAWNDTHSIRVSGAAATSVTGFWDNAVAPTASAPGSTYGHVSKIPVSTLLGGHDVPVIVASQNWWGSSGHIDNGESSSNAMQEANQVADQISRGFAGQVVAWDGPGRTEDAAVTHIMASAEASASGYKFAVRFEDNYLTSTAFCPSGPDVACLNTGLAYIASHYASSSAYMKDPASGKPILFFFLSENYDLVTAAGVEPSGMVFVMLKPRGIPTSSNVIGEFDWVGPTDDGTHSTTTSGAGAGSSFTWDPDFGFSEAQSFFTAASANQGAFLVSAAYKGFDDSLATWSKKRLIDQQCGMTWLQTFDHTGSFGGSSTFGGTANYLSSGKKVDMVMVDTWDDYEEGTEIETGIDNCMTAFDVTLDGSTLRWTPSWGNDPMNDAVSGSEATVFKYAIFAAAPGGSEVMWLKDITCASGSCDHTLDVSTLGITGGPYAFYVQAVGQPSIVNHVAGPTTSTFTAP